MSNIPLTKDLVGRIKSFLTTGKIPSEMARSSGFKFQARYGNGDWTLVDGVLKFQGKIVVPREEISEVLERLYLDPLYTQNSGPRFWNRISTEYANISRSDCTDFLATKKVPQQMKAVPRVEITPINTRVPREHFNIDFIDLKNNTHANLGNRYLLNVIDHFSKYAWSFPLKSRDSDGVTEKMRRLFLGGNVPMVLHADNEFRADSLVKLCKEANVELVSSEPYAPCKSDESVV
jgi:hypothetical protein